jgi:hypothetical protein
MSLFTSALISELNQYTLIQKKLLLDWIELPIGNDEEARNRFLESLSNISDPGGDINEIEINKKLNLLIEEIALQGSGSDLSDPPELHGPPSIDIKSLQQKCKLRCMKEKGTSKYDTCFNDCMDRETKGRWR